jgi:type II restriction/modification system DNA methylase subunit YeeA
LARVSVWIGEIQWMREHGFDASRNPILKPLETIECRDALLNEDGSEAEWPEADVIIGNPPFLGSQRFIEFMGEAYAERLRTAFESKVSGSSDLVVYWFKKAWDLVADSEVERVGLVATNSIRHGANNECLKEIVEDGIIFDAWSDEAWVVEGAAVRVSIVSFQMKAAPESHLDGKRADRIFADLSSDVEVAGVRPLPANAGLSFQGTIKTGPFDVRGDLAREWLRYPLNPNQRPNSDVLRPWANGLDITRRPSGRWIVDFGVDTREEIASVYEAPFKYLKQAFEKANAERARRGSVRFVDVS